MRKIIVLIWLLSFSAAFLGCARVRPILPLEAEPAKLAWLYASLTEPLDKIDSSAVAGKRIVIDPGHGGRFPGAVGSGGVTEAEVNLGVGLYLWGLLEEAGAESTLTRTADTHLAEVQKEDLQARVDITQKAEADIFISLHHNADIVPDSQKNQIETYYKMDDPGPSLDLAHTVHRHLVRNLGIKENKILAGNYYVLRHSSARAALLGEASYLSNKWVEERLRLAAAQRLEAGAYFLGLCDYLSKGIPEVVEITPSDETVTEAMPRISATIKDGPGGAGIDPASIRLRLDGQIVNHHYLPEAGQIIYIPPDPLTNGEHRISIDARNLKGNALRTVSTFFTVDLPPQSLEFTFDPPILPPDGQTQIVVIAVVKDKYGHPIRDGSIIQFQVSQGHLSSDTAAILKGEAITYLSAKNRGAISVRTSFKDLAAERQIASHYPTNFALVSGFVQDGLDNNPVKGAVVVLDDERIVYANRDGFFSLPDVPPDRHVFSVSSNGYIPVKIDLDLKNQESKRQDLPLLPVGRGVLKGQVFVVDPEFGGGESGAIGPTSMRASDVNLVVARYLKDYLVRAGAKVFLTREFDVTTPLLERVKLANAVEADRFVSIGHGDSSNPALNFTYTAHYPNSKLGVPLAKAVQAHLVEALGYEDQGDKDSSAYCLVQTACPAIYTHASLITHPEEETRLSSPIYNRKEAYAIYNGILASYGLTNHDTASLIGQVLNKKGEPVANALVTVDDYLMLQTGEDGVFRFLYLEPGNHRLKVEGQGFAGVEKTDVILQAGEKKQVDVIIINY
ncbi:MAG: N-acetylmuramoyl-L-alanine amidase [bacterium]